ncbi:MAG: MFS transporter [Candidatus Azobacteroides sp.]|nr:MFS transporter [Candidatus Azobacteroides sp.]
MNNKNNFFTFFCLYIAQQIPMSFFATIMPVIMRQEKFSLSTIGYTIAILKVPWILKFLWSPVVDRFNVTIKDYKRWIILSELIFAFFIFSVTFFDFVTSFYAILVVIILSFFASATGDIATDALATQSFDRKDKSMINSMQSMGSFGGAMIGGGVLLWIYKHTEWSHLTHLLAFVVILALLPLFFNRGLTINRDHSVVKQVKMKDLFHFFTQRGIGKQIGLLLLYYVSMIGTLAMISPYLVDLGYDTKQIGTMRGFLGPATGLVASFVGGLIIRKIGRHYSRILFSILVLFTTFYFYWISTTPHPEIQLLYIGILLLFGSYGMATVVVYTLSMDCARKGREGTDFTIQTVLSHLSGIVIVLVSGQIAHHAGYTNLFLFEFGLACLSLIYILVVYRKKETND